jgi:hypothetical protein
MYRASAMVRERELQPCDLMHSLVTDISQTIATTICAEHERKSHMRTSQMEGAAAATQLVIKVIPLRSCRNVWSIYTGRDCLGLCNEGSVFHSYYYSRAISLQVSYVHDIKALLEAIVLYTMNKLMPHKTNEYCIMVRFATIQERIKRSSQLYSKSMRVDLSTTCYDFRHAGIAYNIQLVASIGGTTLRRKRNVVLM